MGIEIRKVSIEDLNEVTEVEASCFPEAEAIQSLGFKTKVFQNPNTVVLNGMI